MRRDKEAAVGAGSGDALLEQEEDLGGVIGGDTRVSSYADWIDQMIGPPRIAGVTVSGTNPADAPYPIPSGSGAQLLSIPVSGINTITVHFNEDVNISGQAFKLTSALDCDEITGVCQTYRFWHKRACTATGQHNYHTAS